MRAKAKIKELKKQVKESRKLGAKELTGYKGFEDINDKEALIIIETLYTLAESLLTINLDNHE